MCKHTCRGRRVCKAHVGAGTIFAHERREWWSHSLLPHERRCEYLAPRYRVVSTHQPPTTRSWRSRQAPSGHIFRAIRVWSVCSADDQLRGSQLYDLAMDAAVQRSGRARCCDSAQRHGEPKMCHWASGMARAGAGMVARGRMAATRRGSHRTTRGCAGGSGASSTGLRHWKEARSRWPPRTRSRRASTLAEGTHRHPHRRRRTPTLASRTRTCLRVLHGRTRTW